jgi:hypothetical protein
MGELSDKLDMRAIQRHTAERNLLNASQFGFRAHHSTTLRCMGPTDHVTPKFEQQYDDRCGIRGHHSTLLLYKQSEMEFSTSLSNPTASLLFTRQRNMNVAFSANFNATSLQWSWYGLWRIN